MRPAILALAVLLAGAPPATAGRAGTFHAGVSRLTVTAVPNFDVLVWYPTQVEEIPWAVGPFSIRASRDAAVAPGDFPIVLLSHGGGPGGGTPLILSELAASLARQGFVVAAPFHGNTARSLAVRPRQVVGALEALLSEPRFTGHADPGRLGMLGFSLGGAVTLILAGAVASDSRLATYCAAHPEDTMSCSGPFGGTPGDAASVDRPAGPRQVGVALPLKAIVLLDPLAVPFDRDGLAFVRIPMLVYRPANSALGAEGNALALVTALPRTPRLVTVPGGHFVFADACTPLLQTEAPDVCQEDPGIDRVAVHARIEPEIAAFFHEHL